MKTWGLRDGLRMQKTLLSFFKSGGLHSPESPSLYIQLYKPTTKPGRLSNGDRMLSERDAANLGPPN